MKWFLMGLLVAITFSGLPLFMFLSVSLVVMLGFGVYALPIVCAVLLDTVLVYERVLSVGYGWSITAIIILGALVSGFVRRSLQV